MLGVGIVAMVPVIVSYFDRTDSQKVAVYISAPQAPPDLVSNLGSPLERHRGHRQADDHDDATSSR